MSTIFDCRCSEKVGGLFPEGFTEEAALTELHDGRIYYNSRSHSGYYDKAFARKLRPDETLRRISLTLSRRMSGTRRTYSRTQCKDVWSILIFGSFPASVAEPSLSIEAEPESHVA